MDDADSVWMHNAPDNHTIIRRVAEAAETTAKAKTNKEQPDPNVWTVPALSITLFKQA